jgi:hypothetical protein
MVGGQPGVGGREFELRRGGEAQPLAASVENPGSPDGASRLGGFPPPPRCLEKEDGRTYPADVRPIWQTPGGQLDRAAERTREQRASHGGPRRPEAADECSGGEPGHQGPIGERRDGESVLGVVEPEVGLDLRVARQQVGEDRTVREEQRCDGEASRPVLAGHRGTGGVMTVQVQRERRPADRAA